MSSTTLTASGPLLKIGGGGFIQNLSTGSSVFVAYTPNPLERDAVIGPGGSYTTGADVWLSTDGAACPVTWNQDSSAVATSPTNIVASVPGGVDVNITGSDTALPVTGTVQATIANASLQVAGSVNISNTVNAQVAGGTLAVSQGNINALNAWTNVVSSAAFSIPPGTTYTAVTNYLDVRSAQSVLVSYGNNNSGVLALCGYTFIWYDTGGNVMFTEEVLFWQGGSGIAIVPVKGAYLTVNTFIDYTLYGNYAWSSYNTTLAYSTIAVPEMYYARPFGGAWADTVNQFASPYPLRYGDVMTGGLQALEVRNTGTGAQYFTSAVASYGRMMNGTIQYGGLSTSGLAVVTLQAGVKSTQLGSWPTIYGTNFSGQTSLNTYRYFSAEMPKTPLMLNIEGISTDILVTMGYQRF